DLAGAPDARALDDRQADTAAAEHRNGLPGLEPRAAQRRADTGQDAAADERGAVERDLRIDAHDRVLVQQHLLGIARDADELTERRAVLRQPRRRRLWPRDDAAGAQSGVARQALRAAAAKAGEAGNDMIARPHGRHVGADRLDDAGALMSEHDRPVEREAADAVDDMQIAVADAGRDGAHEHLAPQRLVHIDRFDRQEFMHFAENGGFDLHSSLLAWQAIVGRVERSATRRRAGRRPAGYATLHPPYGIALCRGEAGTEDLPR